MKKISRFRALLLFTLILSMLCGLIGCGLEVESIKKIDESPEPVVSKVTVDEAANDTEDEAVSAEEAPEAEPEVEEEIIDGLLLKDEDGDGIINHSFKFKGATVYCMFVLDPSRVFLGTSVTTPGQMWGSGKTLDVFLEEFDAVGGMNAGVFDDPSGSGSGWPPVGITYSNSDVYNDMQWGPVVGLNDEDKLVNGYYSFEDTTVMDIRDCVSFEPVFVNDGVKADTSTFSTGIGARSAIGQLEDGTIVFVVADGRQGYSVGISLADMGDIMFDKLGCYNAANMDGGNSSCMAFEGELVNNPSNQAGGTRSLPTAWLVKRVGADYVAPEGIAKRVILPEEQEPERIACPEEYLPAMQGFADEFTNAYYGYYGTSYADMYYPTLGQYVADGSDLRQRMDWALMDRKWVNTYQTALSNKQLEGAYDNGDGTYTIEYRLDIFEYSTYWTYEAFDTLLKITVVMNDYGPYGMYAIATE